MSFLTTGFIVFFLIVFALYYLPLKTSRWQNVVLLCANCVFYGLTSWKMLCLMLTVIVAFYFLGKQIAKAASHRRAALWMSVGVAVALGMLFCFKYLNVFVSSLHILLPLGISYFTFKLISYVVDIYHRKTEPAADILTFGVYVLFFPTLLSGPIDRPQFMQQLRERRQFDYSLVVEGCRQLLWGCFKKVLIADSCALYVNFVWQHVEEQNSVALLLAMLLYAMQLYADFSGYSDIAIGLGKMLGLEVMRNFRTPFFSLNIADFWRRWHISLTSWLTEYVFMPLNVRFRDMGVWGTGLAVIINMLLVGLWHGASWTYVVFGLYHGLLMAVLWLMGRNRVPRNLTSWGQTWRMVLTFGLVLIGWVVFRAPDLHAAGLFLKGIATFRIGSIPMLYSMLDWLLLGLSVALMLGLEWHYRAEERTPVPHSRWMYYGLVLMIWWGITKHPIDFIYFQF